MRKIAAYYLLLFYAASVCKPAAIWFADEMAHCYFGHQHAATVHKQDGARHVHRQVTQAAKGDAPEQKATVSKTNEEVTLSFFTGALRRTESLLSPRQHSLYASRLCLFVCGPPPPPPWA